MAAHNFQATECPADGQRMLCLLGPRVDGKRIPNYGITFHECDLYGDKNPWEIWEALGGGSGDGDNSNEKKKKKGSRELYIFSTIKVENHRTIRNIGLGKWEPHCKDVTVEADDGTQRRMGVRRCFRFDKSGTDHDGAWILHEYSLNRDYLLPLSVQIKYNHVLCKLFKNNENPREQVTNKRPRSTNLELAASDAAASSENVQVDQGVDKRIKVEETTAEERPTKKKKGKPQQVVGDKKITVEETIDDDHEEQSNKGAVKQQESKSKKRA